MKEPKTRPTEASVSDFLDSIDDEEKRNDSKKIDKYFREITGKKPKMWGSYIVGYGAESLKYASGEELDWMETGFSPRKQNLALYVLNDNEEGYTDLLSKLGKHSTGKVCLYIKRLSDVDEEVLKQIIKKSYKS